MPITDNKNYSFSFSMIDIKKIQILYVGVPIIGLD